VKGVTSVNTDMSAHTVTVAFDDEALDVDRIIQALGKAGYSVPEYRRLAD
jgi:copper chaperone CopZ